MNFNEHNESPWYHVRGIHQTRGELRVEYTGVLHVHPTREMYTAAVPLRGEDANLFRRELRFWKSKWLVRGSLKGLMIKFVRHSGGYTWQLAVGPNP